MVQIIQESNPQGRISEMLGLSLGQGLGTGINTYFANKALDDVLNDKSNANQPISAKMGKLQSALAPYGDLGEKLFQQRFQLEHQARQEDEQSILGKAVSGEKISPKDLSKISPENQLKLLDLQKRRQAGQSVYDSLLKSGYPPETADLWKNQIENSPTGGQTDVIKNVNDLIRRSKSGKGLGADQSQAQLQPKLEIPGFTDQPLDLDFPELPEPIGVTPADIVRQNEYREKTNTPLYNEAVDRSNALEDEYREIKHLQDLNEIPDALPTGLQKWNVDWESGDLRVKALATPEAQDYVKTIARMARRAKDFFPGRVTNFDLDQFKQGFPTLANSPEGRRIIAEQLALGNRIAYLKDETYKSAMEHYGSGADPILIKKYATDNYRRIKTQLEDKLKSVNSMAENYISKQPASLEKPPLDQAKTLDDIF